MIRVVDHLKSPPGAILLNESNKLQLTQHLADFLLLDESTLGRDVFVTIRDICATVFRQNPELFFNQREAAPRLAFHTKYLTATQNTCVVADDTYHYENLSLKITLKNMMH